MQAQLAQRDSAKLTVAFSADSVAGQERPDAVEAAAPAAQAPAGAAPAPTPATPPRAAMELKAIQEAIARVEQQTDAELVTVLAARADGIDRDQALRREVRQRHRRHRQRPLEPQRHQPPL